MSRQKNRLSAGLLKSGKVDNHPATASAKGELRENVLAAIATARGGLGEVAVFDAFAGSGEMYRRAWHRAGRYVGCDERWFRDDSSTSTLPPTGRTGPGAPPGGRWPP